MATGDDASEYRIKIVTQSDGSGADQTVTDLRKVAVTEDEVAAAAARLKISTEDARKVLVSLKAEQMAEEFEGWKEALRNTGDEAETGGLKIGKMVEEAGGMRESRRLAMELFESMRGGDASVSGLSGIARYALLSSEALGPLGPLAPALAALTLGFISVWATHKEKAEEAKDAVEQDLDESGNAVKTYAQQWVDSLKTVLGAQTDLQTSDKAQIDAMKEKLRLTQEQMKLDQQAAIERARGQYLIAAAAAPNEEERAKLKKQFEATEQDIKDQGTVNTSALAVQNKKDELAQAEQSLNSSQSTRGNNARKLDEAQDTQAAARNFLGSKGNIRLDGQGNPTIKDESGDFIDLNKWASSQIDPAQKEANTIRENLANKSYMPRDVDAAQQQLQRLQEHIDKAKLFMTQVNLAAKNVNVYDDAKKELDPKLKEQDAQIATQAQQILTMQEELNHLQQAHEQSITDAEHNVVQQALDQKGDQETEAKKAKDAANQAAEKKRKDDADAVAAKINKVDAALADPTLTPEKKAELERQKVGLENQKLDVENAPVDGQPVPPGHQQLIDSEKQKNLAAEQGGETKAEMSDADKRLGELSNAVGVAVKQSGHPELEAELKEMLAATKNSPMQKVLDLLQLISQTIATQDSHYHGQLDGLKNDIKTLQARYSALRNGNNN